MDRIEETLRSLAELSASGPTLKEYADRGMREEYIQKLMKDFDRQTDIQALRDVILQKKKSYFSAMIDTGIADERFPIFKELREFNDKNIKSDFVFVTLCPDPKLNVSILDILASIKKIDKKTWIKKKLYVIEQRGENLEELGKGTHLHFLLEKGDYRFSHIKREFGAAFVKMGDPSNPGFLDIKMVKEKDIPNWQNYITARKKDPSKWIKQDMDIIFRQRYNIPPYYGELFQDVAAV